MSHGFRCALQSSCSHNGPLSAMPTFLSLGLLVLGLFPVAFAVRIVVDDANSSWTYSSPWNAVSPSNPCSSCLINPDPSKALNQTWHDTAYVNTAQLSFTGVSIEMYTICPPGLSDGDSYGTNFTFTLDSIADGTFVGPRPCPQFTYNYLVYARTNLSLAQHTVVITNNQLDARPNSSSLLLDYAVYDDGSAVPAPNPATPSAASTITSSNTPTAKSRSFPLAAVIAPSAVAGLLLLVVVVQFCLYRRRGRRSPSRVEPGMRCLSILFTKVFALMPFAPDRSYIISNSNPPDQSSTQLLAGCPRPSECRAARTDIPIVTAAPQPDPIRPPTHTPQSFDAGPMPMSTASQFYGGAAVYSAAPPIMAALGITNAHSAMTPREGNPTPFTFPTSVMSDSSGSRDGSVYPPTHPGM